MNCPRLAILLPAAVLLSAFEQPLLSQRLLPSIWEKPPQAPAPDLTSLKIVIVAGEDGVNIVKKKSAVQPVIEVRDKNNVPVSGAVVNLTTPNVGPSAVFSNGSRTLSLVTNASGRAVVTGMHPVAVGTFHITVTAAIQGHVVATAAIAQTNVAVAAAAAGAAGGAAGAATGASAGGLSGAAVAGIAGGVAAAAATAAVVATHVLAGKPTATITAGVGTVTAGAPH